MDLRQRSNLVHLEKALHSHWSLGQNSILSWSPLDEGVLILVVPHYAIAEYTSPGDDDMPPRVSPRFITLCCASRSAAAVSRPRSSRR